MFYKFTFRHFYIKYYYNLKKNLNNTLITILKLMTGKLIILLFSNSYFITYKLRNTNYYLINIKY